MTDRTARETDCDDPDQTGAASISAYIDAAVPVARPDETAGTILGRLSEQPFAAVDPVYVLGTGRTLVGAVPLTVLLAAPAGTLIADLVDRDWPTAPITASRETAASLMIKCKTPALAILDSSGAFVGSLVATSVMAILRDEHLEDLHHMVGILSRTERAKLALTAPPHRRAFYRLPWLLVGLVGASAATGLMAQAEAALSAHIAVAFFVPAIVYLADAIGTQTEAVAVRGLSITDGNSLRLLLGELGTGTLIGSGLAIVSFVVVTLVFSDVHLALTVALALAVSGAAATSIGFLLPWLFQRLGLDPAHGAGPVATVIQDILSLGVYLGLVRWLMV